MITSNDVVLHRDILAEALKLSQTNEDLGYQGGKVFDLDTGRKLQYAGGRSMVNGKLTKSRGNGEYDIGQYENVEYFDYMDDVCSFVKTDMIKEIGAYDDDFFFDWEETEWNNRIMKSKYKIAYNPKMVVWHRKHGSTGGTRFREIPEKYHWRGKMLFYYKTISNPNLKLYYLIKFLMIEVPIHWLYLIVRNNTKLVSSNLRGILSGLLIIINSK